LSLTIEQYRAELKKLGLRPHGATTENTDFYLTRDNSLESVPKPEGQTAAQRQETISKLKLRLGIGVFRG
jgi:hypothetical protein